MKKAWSKPTLISLYRGRPEEAVLLFCKTPRHAYEAGPETPGNINCDPQTGTDDCMTLGVS